MFQDISRIVEFLKSDDAGLRTRRNISIILLVSIVLLLANRFIFLDIVSDKINIRLQQARILFINGKSPYDKEIFNYLKSQSVEEGFEVEDEDLRFEAPLFQLIFYFPFSLIPDLQWAAAAFITFLQICIYLSTLMIIKLLKNDLEFVYVILLFGISICSIFIFVNMQNASIVIVQISILIAALYFEEKNKPMLSGIMLGLTFIDPITVFFSIFLVILIFFQEKKFINLIWSSITIVLLSIFMMIFDDTWALGWLKDLFLTPSRYPFLTYPNMFEMKYGIETYRILMIVPIFLISWTLLEMLRTSKRTSIEWMWLLSLSGIINYYVMIQIGQDASVLFLPGFLLVSIVWLCRIPKVSRRIFIGVISIVSILITEIYIATPIINLNGSMEIVFLILAILLLSNLYWTRNWIIKPFDINNNKNQIF